MDMYNFYYNQVMNQIEKKGSGVLATSYKDMPTTRMVSVVVYDDKIAFQTSYKLEKFDQLVKNNSVALCFTNINISGKAIVDNRQVLQNSEFIERFEVKHNASFKAYSHMESNRVIEILPEKIVVWIYENGEPYRVFLDVTKQECQKEAYDHLPSD